MRNYIIQTERLQLREMTDRDLKFLVHLLSDPAVMQFYPKPLNSRSAMAWIERRKEQYQSHGYSLWLVERRHGRTPVGQVGLVPQVVQDQEEDEIGYMIARRFWDRGYAIEAAKGVRHYAHKTLQKHRLVSLIRPENSRSRAVAVKLGMGVERMVVWGGYPHELWVIEDEPLGAMVKPVPRGRYLEEKADSG